MQVGKKNKVNFSKKDNRGGVDVGVIFSVETIIMSGARKPMAGGGKW